MQEPSKQAKLLVLLIAVWFSALQPDTVTERTTQVKTAHPVDLYFPKIAQLLLTPEVCCFISVGHFILMS